MKKTFVSVGVVFAAVWAAMAGVSTGGTVTVGLLYRLAESAVLGGLVPAEATAIEMKDGKVNLSVVVRSGTDLSKKGAWDASEIEVGPLASDGKGVTLALPVAGERGFYLLESK